MIQMTYQVAVEQLYALGHELAATPSHKFDLAYVREMLAAPGNPERRFPSVLIAGTNGKGSTAATLSSILRVAGYKTGLYTSPHLVSINERIRVNGEAIADIEFSEIYDRVERTAQELQKAGKLPWHPSFFEMLTVMAFEYFASVSLDIAVFEVGMGGRLDATNVVDPLISVITDISLDHQKFLGNTIAEIAAEKAGIIREKGLVVTLPQHPEANDVIGNTILEKNATAMSAVKYTPPVSPGAREYLAGIVAPTVGRNRYPLNVLGEEIVVDSPLGGRHQYRNIALAIATAEQLGKFGFRVTARQVEQGIRETHWPGRFQVVAGNEICPKYNAHYNVIFDVAHNPAGAWALRSAISETFPDREITLIFAAMRDKAVQEMAEILFPIARQVIVTHVDSPRAATTEELLHAGSRTGAEICAEPTVASALQRAFEQTPRDNILVVTGSIFLVGDSMKELGIPA
jgi:dihydrofolate synthase / folylpolyglutamate synthase